LGKREEEPVGIRVWGLALEESVDLGLHLLVEPCLRFAFSRSSLVCWREGGRRGDGGRQEQEGEGRGATERAR
jgi:hypothetical protein